MGDDGFLVQRHGDRADVFLRGTLLATDAPTLRRRLGQLIHDGVTEVELDLSQIHDIAPAGLAAVVVASRRLRARRGELRVVAMSRECGQTIDRLHVLSGVNDCSQA